MEYRDKLAKRKSELENERKQKTEEIYNKDGIYNDYVKKQESLNSLNKLSQSKIFQNNPIISRGTSYPTVGYRDDGTPIKKIKRTVSANNSLKNNK